MQFTKNISISTLIACCFFSYDAIADTEIENNDTFSSRNIYGPGVTTINGELSNSFSPDFIFSDFLTEGQVNSYSETGLTAGTLFYGAINNSISGIDTFLGTFDEFNNPINTNDDSSPFGDGYADALGGTVNTDGSIHFSVTGCCDNFTGTHTESGNYDLLVFLGIDSPDDIIGYDGDVDFLSITGLTPGTQMIAEITSATFDSTLGLFDNTGALVTSDDDGGNNVFSLLNVVVGDDGILTFAVSGFSDFDFIAGSHNQSGEYQLSLTAVPAPAALWLFASSMLGLIGFGNSKQKTK